MSEESKEMQERAPAARSPTAEEVAEELGERVAARGYVTYDDFKDALLAAEQRRDAVWTEALNQSHYDHIDGLHIDPQGHGFYCAACAPLRALLSGERAAQAAPSSTESSEYLRGFERGIEEAARVCETEARLAARADRFDPGPHAMAAQIRGLLFAEPQATVDK